MLVSIKKQGLIGSGKRHEKQDSLKIIDGSEQLTGDLPSWRSIELLKANINSDKFTVRRRRISWLGVRTKRRDNQPCGYFAKNVGFERLSLYAAA